MAKERKTKINHSRISNGILQRKTFVIKESVLKTAGGW